MEIFVFLFTNLMSQKKNQKTKSNTCSSLQIQDVKSPLANFLHVYSPSATSMTGLISEPGSAGPLS
jgi:hypothetical protein